jgi:hypothetical protein
MDLEEQNCSKDQRVGSSSPDLFSSILRQMVVVVCLLLASTKYVPFDEGEAAARYMVTMYERPRPYQWLLSCSGILTMILPNRNLLDFLKIVHLMH